MSDTEREAIEEIIKTSDWMPADHEWFVGQEPPQNERERKLVLRACCVLVGKQLDLLKTPAEEEEPFSLADLKGFLDKVHMNALRESVIRDVIEWHRKQETEIRAGICNKGNSVPTKMREHAYILAAFHAGCVEELEKFATQP